MASTSSAPAHRTLPMGAKTERLRKNSSYLSNTASVVAYIWEIEMDNPLSDSMSLVVSVSELAMLSTKLRKVQQLKHISIAVREPLSDVSAKLLEQGIQKNRSLKQLKLALQEVGTGALKTLVCAATRNPCILSLDLSQTAFPSGSTAPSGSLGPDPELLGLTIAPLNLKRLKLGRCKLPEQEFAAVASCLSKSTSSLTYLDLSGNKIPESSALALSQALISNKSLSTLKIRDCALGDAGAQAFASCLAHNATLDHVNLGSNGIGPLGAQAIAQGLKDNKSIGNLNLSHNPFSPAGLKLIIEAISSGDSLREVDFGFTQFDAGTWTLLSQSINTWSKLWRINLSGNMHYRRPSKSNLSGQGGATSPLTSPTKETKDDKKEEKENCEKKVGEGEENATNTLKSSTGSGSSNNGPTEAFSGPDSPLLRSVLCSDQLRAPSPMRKMVAAKKAALLDQVEYAKALEELCSALQINAQISSLDLSHNPLGDAGCKVLGSLLSVNQSIVDIKLKRCEIAMKGVECVSTAMSSNPASSLAFVDLTGNEADSLGTLGISILQKRKLRSLAWRPIRSHPIVQSRPHAEFTSLCPVPSTHEVWVACTDGHVHFWPVSDFDNYDDVMSYVDVHNKDIPVTRRRINAMVACRSTVWVLTDEPTIVVISQAKPHRISYLSAGPPQQTSSEGSQSMSSIPSSSHSHHHHHHHSSSHSHHSGHSSSASYSSNQLHQSSGGSPHSRQNSNSPAVDAVACSERLCMCFVDAENQIAVIGGGSGDVSLWKTSVGEEAFVARKILGSGFPVVAIAATSNLILAGLVMPGRHSSIVVVLDHALEELYRQEVGTSTLSSIVCFGNLVITAFQDGSTRLWHCDAREMALIRSSSHIPTNSIQALPSPSPFFISASGKNKNICVWNPTSLSPVCILDTHLPVKTVALSGPYMAVLTEDEQVSLWMN